MRAILLALLVALPALAACLQAPQLGPQVPTQPGEPPRGVRVESVAEGLQVPWGLAFAPDGRILVTERGGRVRVIEDGALRAEPVATLEVAARGEAGLMGIALDPDFARNDLVYVMYTYGDGGQPLLNRVSRFTLRGGADDEQVLVDGIQGAPVHDGGRIKFGPDGKLYVATGDAANGALAQSDASLNGKVLRVNADGSVPADNPVPGRAIWTRGHRNAQGLAWDEQGRLFATEHGPSGFDGPGGFDELNRLERGANYGWPQKYCSEARSPLAGEGRDPVACYREAIAPAGIAFVPAGRYPGWNASLVFGTLRGQHLHRVEIQDGRLVVDERLYEGEFGRVRDVVLGPDGWLYFTTSNRDGRGQPREGDDHVYRIVVG